MASRWTRAACLRCKTPASSACACAAHRSCCGCAWLSFLISSLLPVRPAQPYSLQAATASFAICQRSHSPSPPQPPGASSSPSYHTQTDLSITQFPRTPQRRCNCVYCIPGGLGGADKTGAPRGWVAGRRWGLWGLVCIVQQDQEGQVVCHGGEVLLWEEERPVFLKPQAAGPVLGPVGRPLHRALPGAEGDHAV